MLPTVVPRTMSIAILGILGGSVVLTRWFWKIQEFSYQKELKSREGLQVKEEAILLSNTNWMNVQYQSGVFDHQPDIFDACINLAGIEFDDLNPAADNRICLGPLMTNTSCCFCEHFPFANRSRYWHCAVPRNNSLAPLNTTRLDTKGASVAWITGKFGHGNKFQSTVDKYCQLVRELNFFEPQDVHCYWESPDYVVQNPTFTQHLRYRNDPNDVSSRGGGFWIHKSLIIRHLLDVYKDGDYLVYTDTDRIDYFELGTFHGVLDTMIKLGNDLCMEVICNSAEHWFTKEDVLTAFNASNSTRQSPQVLANAIVVRNSLTMRRFLDAWIECMANWHMVSDEPSVLPDSPRFEEHRHDQSILSLLVKSFTNIQSVVGPPARAYQPAGEILTFAFREGAVPACPFESLARISQKDYVLPST